MKPYRNFLKTVGISIFCLLFSIACHAQNKQQIKLWPGQPPGQEAAQVKSIIQKDTGRHIFKITEVTEPSLVVFKPEKGNGAAVIISPGGGNRFLSWDLEGTEIASWLNGLGYTAFILQYRIPNQQKGALQDIQRGIRYVRFNAKEFNLDTNKIGVIGFSAGGNLSARAATAFGERTYNPVDKIDSTSCRPNFALLIYPGSMSTGNDRHLIPQIPVSAKTPPVFIFVASDDPYNIPFSMGVQLRANKIPFAFHVVPSGWHGYGLRKGNPAAEAWPSLAEHWLSTVLKK